MSGIPLRKSLLQNNNHKCNKPYESHSWRNDVCDFENGRRMTRLANENFELKRFIEIHGEGIQNDTQ